MEHEELLVAVKNWIIVEEEIKELQSKLKTLKSNKKIYTKNLAELMNKKNIDGLNLNNDSKIVYKKQKVVGGITKKLLISSLSEFIKDNDDLDNIISYILSQRNEKYNDKIELK
tara:strand:- start:54 stop:395 length:342 start_codon:yes stop_codon:yes gene_type:complete